MKKINTLLFVLVILLSACKTEPSEKANQFLDSKKTKTTNNQNTNTDTPSASVQLKTESDQLLFLSKLYLKYSNNGKAFTDQVNAELRKVDNKDLDFVKKFVFSTTQQSEILLSEEFLKKPSKEDLQRIFKLRRVNWNSMSVTGVTTAVIDTFDIGSVNNEELLTAYYRLVSSGIKLSRNINANFQEVNIDLNKLELANNQEKGIIFYTVADVFSRKYNRSTRNSSDCGMAKKMVQAFPRINGKLLFKVAPPKFEDFKVTIGNGAVDKSFKQFFMTGFEKGAGHFAGCK